MRTLLAVGLCAFSLAAWPASAARMAAGTRVACGAKAVDVYFWPHGHPAVPRLHFPAVKQPHLEVYLKASTAGASFLSFMSADEVTFATSCRLVADGRTVWGGGPKKTVTKTRRIRCTFPKQVEIRSTRTSEGRRMFLNLAHTSKGLVDVRIQARGSVAAFDGRYCAATPVAGVP